MIVDQGDGGNDFGYLLVDVVIDILYVGDLLFDFDWIGKD